MSESAIAKKKEAGMAQLVLVLFAISAVVALVLGLTNMITEPYIKENKQKVINNAMAAVLPADNYEKMTDRYAGGDPTIQDIYSAGDAGWVVQVKPSTSFSGNLTVMVGVDADGACSGISIVSSGETSGLGANASKDYFRAQFVGKMCIRDSYLATSSLPAASCLAFDLLSIYCMAAITQAKVRKPPTGRIIPRAGMPSGRIRIPSPPLRMPPPKVPLPRNSRTTHMITRITV